MDTGKINENYTYYEGFEGEREVEMTTSDGKFPVYHIWDGYFFDIFENPPLDGPDWHGFTRDWHQMEGVFEGLLFCIDKYSISNPKEYLDDILQYEDKKFRYEDTVSVYEIIVSMLRHAVENGVNVIMTYS